ncbi:MAG: hypothetical protein ACI831_001077 [Candidatus Azotimanducaceae bacterium]|jgi:uncharacterized protein YqeY
MSSQIKTEIDSAVKDAMRARDKQRLGVLRLIMSEFKRIEVDERIELDDTRVLGVLEKMNKQRRDSFEQFEKAGRQDLADQESFELRVIAEYTPEALSEQEIQALVEAAVSDTGASTMKDMGNLMSVLRPKLQGRADMGLVSKLVKSQLQ